jgi:hypothetical protein
VRVPLDGEPIEITLGLNDKKIHLYPEMRLDARAGTDPATATSSSIPWRASGQIGGFLRLTPQSWLSLGSADAPAAGDLQLSGGGRHEEHLVRDPQPRRPRVPQPERYRRGDRSGSCCRHHALRSRQNRFRRLREVLRRADQAAAERTRPCNSSKRSTGCMHEAMRIALGSDLGNCPEACMRAARER